ncbi:hypothetical protein [Akkermansia sp.]|uniref:hypothetical protein n=1 Tax=Akkermansia sp. TaxID=1872421 RepID=UPI0025C61FF4|nr:hypothetical protein [Akkermansia sp.]MCC8148790.1 hypothetical protein [Akkermansia sp.]
MQKEYVTPLMEKRLHRRTLPCGIFRTGLQRNGLFRREPADTDRIKLHDFHNNVFLNAPRNKNTMHLEKERHAPLPHTTTA